MINLFNWFLGSFFLIAGFLAILSPSNQKIILSLILFSIGVLLLPPIRKFIYSKTKKNIPVALRVILIFFLVILLGVFSKNEDDNSADKAKLNKNEGQKLLEISSDKKTHRPTNETSLSVVEVPKSEPVKAFEANLTGEMFLLALLILLITLYIISKFIKRKEVKKASDEKSYSNKTIEWIKFCYFIRKNCPYCKMPNKGLLDLLFNHSSCPRAKFHKCELCENLVRVGRNRCDECKEQVQNKVRGFSEGQEEIFSIICQSILSGEIFEMLEKKIKEPFELLEIRMIDLKLEYTKEQMLIGGWGKAVSFYLEKGLLGDEEENRLLEFQSYFSFTKDQYPWKLKMAIFLKSVLNGMVPEPEWGKQWDFNSYGVFLHQNEILYWCLDGVKYFEDKIHRHFVGNTNSVSIDIMKGVKYNTGGFTSHEVETKEVLKFSGNLVVTDKNICFNGSEENINFKGSKKSIRIPYARIASIRQIEDGIIIVQDSENAKPQVLKLEDDWNTQFTYNLIMHLSQKKV